MLVAVDTGGTKTLVATYTRSGRITAEVKFPTPRDPADYMELLSTTITDMTDGKDIDAIAVAVPGQTKKGIAIICVNLGWHNVPITAPLKKLFKCPVYLENDANLAGLAEAHALPKKYDNVLYVTISTGIGMGLIIDHTIHPALSITEPGHMVLEYDGKLRKWEDFASGRAIRATYDSYARDIKDRHVWNQIADKISRGFLVLVPAVKPDVIIIGGSIGTYFDKYEKQLQHILTRRLSPEFLPVDLRRAVHPEQAVIYGCYYFALAHLDR